MMATIINYMDRLALNHKAVRIKTYFGMSNYEYSKLESAFSCRGSGRHAETHPTIQLDLNRTAAVGYPPIPRTEASMEASTSPWRESRVLVTGCTAFLGEAVTRELLACGASIVGVARTRGDGARYMREIASGQFRLVHADCRDTARLHSTLAIHEVSAVFHLDDADPHSVLRAVGLYNSRIPVICSRPHRQLALSTESLGNVPPLGIARFGELFGPGQPDSTCTVARLVLALLSGQSPQTTSGIVNDYVFIRDAARACLALAETVGRTGLSHDVSYRSGWELSEMQLTRILSNSIQGLPLDAAPVRPTSPGDWVLERTLADALRETIDWFRQSSIVSPRTRQDRRAA